MKITSTNQSDPVADSQDGKLSDWTGFVHVDGFNVSYGETDDATDSWSEVQFTPDDSDIGEDVLPVVDEEFGYASAFDVVDEMNRDGEVSRANDETEAIKAIVRKVFDLITDLTVIRAENEDFGCAISKAYEDLVVDLHTRRSRFDDNSAKVICTNCNNIEKNYTRRITVAKELQALLQEVERHTEILALIKAITLQFGYNAIQQLLHDLNDETAAFKSGTAWGAQKLIAEQQNQKAKAERLKVENAKLEGEVKAWREMVDELAKIRDGMVSLITKE